MTSKCRFCGRELPKRNFALAGHRPMLITLPCECPQAQEEAEREAREIERRERAQAFASAWVRAGIPDAFAHVDADFGAAAPLFAGRSLYIMGENGRGKTHMACQAAKAFMIRHTYRDGTSMRCWRQCMFVTAQDVLSQLRSSWDRWDQTEEDVFRRWAGVGLLVLDDLGKGVPSEWAAESLFRLVDARWSKNRPMIVTSQYSSDELADRYAKAGEETMRALMSRLDGWSEGIRLEGADRRLENSRDSRARADGV